jgi:ribonuclease BN (tRNA processing enzyme)
VAVVISGDTAVCDGMYRLAGGAHVIVHEALLSAAVHPALLEGNADARSVGELARTTRPHTLVLTHLIPAARTATDEDAFVAEARDGGFTGRIVVARDLLRLEAG